MYLDCARKSIHFALVPPRAAPTISKGERGMDLGNTMGVYADTLCSWMEYIKIAQAGNKALPKTLLAGLVCTKVTSRT